VSRPGGSEGEPCSRVAGFCPCVNLHWVLIHGARMRQEGLQGVFSVDGALVLKKDTHRAAGDLHKLSTRLSLCVPQNEANLRFGDNLWTSPGLWITCGPSALRVR